MAEDSELKHGTPEGAAFFRAALQTLEESQSSLARLMAKYGDDRQPATILRSIQRMANGEARVSGEMRVLLNFMLRGKQKRLAAAQKTVPGRKSEPSLAEF
jgi:hypothetical protein